MLIYQSIKATAIELDIIKDKAIIKIMDHKLQYEGLSTGEMNSIPVSRAHKTLIKTETIIKAERVKEWHLDLSE